jgi:hypothetical protein
MGRVLIKLKLLEHTDMRVPGGCHEVSCVKEDFSTDCVHEYVKGLSEKIGLFKGGVHA